MHFMNNRNMNTENRKVTLFTDRLLIEPLSESDNVFILELVNTDGWIKFIGNRNITSAADAIAYIQKINENQNVTYWTAKLRETNEPTGIITFIKRDYLEHNDIGFAFLPNFNNKGYAFEATQKVLHFLTQNNSFTYILATTIPENISSISLLKKLGLEFDKIIERENEILHVYKSAAHKLKI
jgi:[ribosomal protein S5]-alanine N-acetyltransferase